MQRPVLTTAAAALALIAGAAFAAPEARAFGLGEAGQLAAARANARAGGPVSAADAELLERYGCLSGTDNDFCRRLENRHRSTSHHRRHRKSNDD